MSQLPSIPRKMDILKTLATSPPVPDHVLPGLPTGAVGALVASGGVGKTILLLQTSVALATGQPVLGGLFGAEIVARTPAKVVLVVAEESVDVMHLRLHAVLGSLLAHTLPSMDQDARDRLYGLLHANLDLYPLAGSTRLLIDDWAAPAKGGDAAPSGLETLRAMAAGARLLVIDPLRQFHTGDENDSWAMTSVVQDLQSIASAHRCAVLVAHHTNKSSTFNGQADRAGAARGSAALTDGVRMQLNLSPLDDSLGAAFGVFGDDLARHVRLDLSKSNYLAPQPPQVMRRGAGGVFEAVAGSAGKVPAKRRRAA